ncbi:dTDP-4-dehydrorhamnose 3,5-epimerase [Synechococcales cyanobacterium C]|uniref:dTDP-4-dehydrorhamnose 3,5-epimerase n=1 Tax=Petrachloros mirabilis ULC683 TaxID=2781853 RepID=A0A8K2A1T2_9CYAN|nr:dTDP-4-dehydrorhamnose 3,5-epimerase [Petrachloros mirabilis]NCJ07937.1 dTDP-4-dehydrorhamnose 3,5-epimerase [Petrachloros mirabilis ULC683]
MKLLQTSIPGLLLFEPSVFADHRGFFLESYHAQKYAELGLTAQFVQDNHSFSCQDTLRGLHYQRQHPQGKLVSVIRGTIFDVGVDIRQGSPTFGQWYGACLCGENHHQLYIPPGFAHGFCVLSETADVLYKCTDFYDPTDDCCLRWNDPDLQIDWPVREPLLSAKDASAPFLKDVTLHLPCFESP